jgi:hypothetical protein
MCLSDCFSCFKTRMAFSLILSPPILFGCWFSKVFRSTIRRLTCKKDKCCHRQWQLIFTNNEKAKDEDLNFNASLRCWRLEGIVCLFESFDCYITFEPIIPGSTFHPWLSKNFDAYSVVSTNSSIISFLSYQFFSSMPKLLNPRSPKSRSLIPFKGVVCHISKFPFQNVNHFPQ